MIFSSPPPQFGQCYMSMKDALEQPRPADAIRPGLDRVDLALGGRRGFAGRLLHLRPLRHHRIRPANPS